MESVLVIGGGAAGMMAAIAAARCGRRVEVFEKNEKLGKKIYITGKGRCNLTNDCDMDTLFESVCSNRKFLYSAFYGFSNMDTMDFFQKCGLKIKTERGNRVFPVSDHSSDVIAVLADELKRQKVGVHLNTQVKEILFENKNAVRGIRLSDGKEILADAVIVATGGLSYPTTGSTGDGYRFASQAGHTVTELSPALVPLTVAEADAMEMQGLSLRNVKISVVDGKKTLYEDFGEMMFTHFGVTGPLILSVSSLIQKKLKSHPLKMKIDLKPALSTEQLDARIPPEKAVHDISREERQHLVECTKEFQMTITGLRGYNEAIITRGGVSVKEVNPQTMESKLVKGLYFAGEVLDLDAVTGGFNLQIAWSTGYAAGMAVNHNFTTKCPDRGSKRENR